MIQVFTLPMRNWNDYRLFFCEAAAEFLHYLWGIETWHLLHFCVLRALFLHYLWGIETLLMAQILWPLKLFLHYLWGIETLFTHNAGFSIGSFYITYEELKHPKTQVLTKRCMVFTLPMRNWNYIIHWPPFSKFLSFYITYEELKLGKVVERSRICFWFLHYLWGIETQYLHC